MKNLHPSVTSVPNMGQNLFRKYLTNLKSYEKKNQCLKRYYICKSQVNLISYIEYGISFRRKTATDTGNYLKHT